MSIEVASTLARSAGQGAVDSITGAQHRIEALVDPGSFDEFGSLVRHRPPGDGVITGYTRIDGRSVGLFAQDSTVLGGSLGEMHAKKIVQVLGYAERVRTPVIGLLDSGGARIQEGVAALDGYGAIFRANVRLSGRIPQISVGLGPCAGGAVYSPALTDIVIMQRGRARMFLTGPRVVQAVTHEEITSDDLGGAEVHSTRSGLVHLAADDAASALDLARAVLSYLPNSCWELPPMGIPAGPEPMPQLPASPRSVYDVRAVIRGIIDTGSFLELQPRFARNLVIGFARIDGRPIGMVANQPQTLAGVLDIQASEKGARFVRLCDAFGLPLITLVGTPGFLPGRDQESGGVIRKGAKLLYAYAEATVILRKAFGGAYIVMNSRSLGADAVFSWPSAEISVMGAEGAVNMIFRKDIQADPARGAEFLEQYRAEAMVPQISAERLSIDEIIPTDQTRQVIASTLRSLHGANRPQFRHDNLPQ